MIPEVKRILYATDLSENAKYAFGYAADLAQRYDASITILFVMESINHTVEIQVKEIMGQEEWDKLKADKLEYLNQKIISRIENFCKEMNDQFDSCRLLVEDIKITKGNPTDEILTISKDINADMIVMGSYGHNILQSALLIGGTARKVVQSSEIPVLVVRLPKE
ncbi:MAG: universal stress protein [Desulfobacteraceae bacterium]|nr:universal stress protein [Desulfobacteraceae bacterium]